MSGDEIHSGVHPANQGMALEVEGAVEAPILFFDDAPALGAVQGVGRILLCALVQDVRADGTVFARKKAVAQLRGNYIAFDQLRAAINQIEQMITPPAGPAN